MTEYIISDKCLDYIRAKSYEAGQRGQEVYTVRGADGEEVVRCRECEKSRENGWKCTRFAEEVYDEEHEIGELMMANVQPDGHCAWGERDT